MPEITALFIDDGGVMNDDALRVPEWHRLVAEFFVPILGGNRAQWVEANRVVFERLRVEVLTVGHQGQDYAKWLDEYQLRWLREMAALVHVAAPADDAQCIRLAEQAGASITRRVRSIQPGAVEAIRALHSLGLNMFTASGEPSWELDGYLTGMDVRDCFQVLYGPDLINQAKENADYYRKVFAHAGVDPKRALVVDDSPSALAWAQSVGAATCLVNIVPPPNTRVDFVVSRLADLPAALGGSI